MIRKLLFVSLLLVSVFVRAQDTLYFNPSVPYLSKQENIIFTFSLDNWKGVPSGIQTRFTRSRGFSLMFMLDDMHRRRGFGFAYGIGFTSQNVHSNAAFHDSLGKMVLSPLADSLGVTVNKLSLNFISIAAELRFHLPKNIHGNQWKFNAGLKGGLLVQDHIKQENRNGKSKSYDTPHLRNFQYGITARLGYSFVAINGYYSLVPVFTDSFSGEQIPYSIGLSIMF
jgi:hypothetical protein